jgi:ProP effector
MTMETRHHATLKYLAERFPQTFVLEIYQPHRPLKIGIAADIVASCPELDRRVVGKALGTYTGRIMYLRAFVEGAVRVDLDGHPAGEVSAADAEHAAARLAEILASREALAAAVQANKAARSARQTAVPTPAVIQMPPPRAVIQTVAASAPATAPAARVLLKERPVLRLPARRR